MIDSITTTTPVNPIPLAIRMRLLRPRARWTGVATALKPRFVAVGNAGRTVSDGSAASLFQSSSTFDPEADLAPTSRNRIIPRASMLHQGQLETSENWT